MTDIDVKVLEQAASDIRQRLMDYSRAIERAYIKCEDPVFVISLGAKFSEDKDGLKIETPITFTSEKIKDKGISYYDPNGKSKPKQLGFDDLDSHYREILFRDFSEIRNRLMRMHKRFMYQYRLDFGLISHDELIKFRRFDLAA